MSDLTVLAPFYSDYAAFYGSEQRSVRLPTLLLERRPDQGNLPEQANSLFISDLPAQEAAARISFWENGPIVNFLLGSRYSGEFVGIPEDTEAWVVPQVEHRE